MDSLLDDYFFAVLIFSPCDHFHCSPPLTSIFSTSKFRLTSLRFIFFLAVFFSALFCTWILWGYRWPPSWSCAFFFHRFVPSSGSLCAVFLSVIAHLTSVLTGVWRAFRFCFFPLFFPPLFSFSGRVLDHMWLLPRLG